MSPYNNHLEEIKSRVDIVDFISEYVSLKKAGQNWRGLCPFHSEKTPSFMVSPSKQIFHCFGCGSGGDIFAFLVKYENLTFKESLNLLAKRAGVELSDSSKYGTARGEKEPLMGLYKDANFFYQENLRKNPAAMSYLAKRGIDTGSQKLFSIGYAPEKWDALFSYLKRKDYKPEIIKKAGLVSSGTKGYYDAFRNRIIFPIFDLRGDVVAFGGRVMDDSLPKYLNSSESLIFSKSKILYGLNLAKDSIKKMGFVIFVEGYIDVITTHIHGFTNAVAPLGTSLTHEHGKLIKRFTKDTVLVFDGDEAGIKAAKNGIRILSENGLDTKVLLMPRGEDPDSLLRKKGKDVFAALLQKAVPVVDFFVMQKGDKYVIAQEAIEAIAKIPDSVKRGDYVKQLADRMRFNETDLREEMAKVIKRSLPKPSLSGQHVKAAGTPPAARPLHEVYMLQLVLQFPEKAVEVFENVSDDDFEDPVTKSIYKKMQGGLTDYNTLIAECGDDEKSLLTGILFNTEFENPEKIFRDCLKRLKSKKRSFLLNELQDKIKRAEQERDNTLLKTLLLEKQKLLKLK